jgi:outer membrane protein assembly factor BamB
LIVAGIVAAMVPVAVAACGGGDGGDGRQAEVLHPGPLEDAELVVDGDAVCSTSGSQLFCVDAVSGEELFSEALPGVATPPALVGGTLVVAADGGPERGDLYGYSLDGRQLWVAAAELQVRDVEAGAPARPRLPVAGDIVAIPSGLHGGGSLVGVDAGSGREAWRALPRGGPIPTWSGPLGQVVSDGRRFYTVGLAAQPEPGSVPALTLVALDGATGAELWRVELDDELASVMTTGIEAVAPVADGSAMAFALRGQPGRVVVLDAATGAHRWDVPLTSESGSVAHVEDVTIVSDGAELRGYDNVGTELWTVSRPGSDVATRFPPELDVEDGELYAFRLHVSVIDPTDGTARTLRQNVRPTDVAVAGGNLVIAGTQLETAPLPT